MRTEMQARKNRPWSWPGAILTGALAALALLAGVASRGYSDEPKPDDWLKLNENGEPCEVTLADGTVLKLDTYGRLNQIDPSLDLARAPRTEGRGALPIGKCRRPRPDSIRWNGVVDAPRLTHRRCNLHG